MIEACLALTRRAGGRRCIRRRLSAKRNHQNDQTQQKQQSQREGSI